MPKLAPLDQVLGNTIDSWEREGIGDTELGAKYLVYREKESAFAVSGGLPIPTGYEDDADKLNDVASSLDQITPAPGIYD